MPPRSRQTRHQDVASRSRAGHIIDLDPTDGLPVQRYGLQKVVINQDASTNLSSTNPKSTSSAEWNTQFGTEQHPWAEPALPSYFAELSPWNAEMIRKARAGNTNRIVSTWDRKNNCWISGAEQERKAATMRTNSQNNTDSVEKPQNGNDAASSKSDDESGAEDSSDKSADEDEFDGDEAAPFKTSSKRRKVTSRQQGPDDTRTFEVTRWVALPPSQTDKVLEKTYLAPRRPGMPALYAPEYAQKMFGQYHSSATLTGNAGYDLGEGGGLNNASGVLAAGSTNDGGTATPRKNIPPRRKKKKLGGPGRKKANPNPEATGDANGQQNATGGSSTGQDGGDGSNAMEGVLGEDGQPINTGGNTNRNIGYDGTNDDATAQDQDDGDNDESGSEAEGSEEGEIDESGGAGTAGPEIEHELVKEEEVQLLPTVEVTTAEIQEPIPVPSTIVIESEPIAELLPEPEVQLVTEPQPVPEAEPEIEPITITETVTETKIAPTTEEIQPVQPISPIAPSPISISAPAEAELAAPAATEVQESIPEAPQARSPPSISPTPLEEAPPTSVLPVSQPSIAVTASDMAAVEENEDKTKKDATDVEVVGDGGEVDFLGVMDAAIDREVSEGA